MAVPIRALGSDTNGTRLVTEIGVGLRAKVWAVVVLTGASVACHHCAGFEVLDMDEATQRCEHDSRLVVGAVVELFL